MSEIGGFSEAENVSAQCVVDASTGIAPAAREPRTGARIDAQADEIRKVARAPLAASTRYHVVADMKALPANSVALLACVKAAFAYALSVFAIGFGIGTIRVLLLVPRWGATIAALVEAPIMLTVSWIVSLRCTTWWKVGAAVSTRALMGTMAFALLLFEELGVSVVVFGESVTEYLARYRSLPVAIGLVAQICFASFSLLQINIGDRHKQDI